MEWQIEPDVDLQVIIFEAGPFDNPFSTSVDVTRFVGRGEVTIKRGRSDEFTSFNSGSCSFTLKNDNREFDPSNASSPYIDILKPLRRMQVIATYAGVVHVLFTGYIDAWPRGWTKTTGSVPIVAHDAITVMARAKTSPSLGVLVLDHPSDGRLDKGRLAGDLPEQYSGERILSLLQLAGFALGATLNIDTGLTRVVPVEPTGSILQLIQVAERAEAGFFMVDKDGIIRFYDRHSRFQESRIANVQRVFTDSQYAGLEVDHNLTQVWNDVVFNAPDGPEQRETDDASIHDYGVLTFSEELPVLSDPEAASRAQFFIQRYSQPQDRPAPITVSPRRNMPILFPAVAGRELLDRIQTQRTPLGVGPTVTYTGLVESIEHRITNQSWETTLGTSPIDVSDGSEAIFLIIDHSTLGNLDQETLAY